MPLCGLYDGGDSCDVRGERRYKDGWRCPRHTPAALAGHPEPPTPDPCLTAAALMLREDWPPKRTRVYGPPSNDKGDQKR